MSYFCHSPPSSGRSTRHDAQAKQLDGWLDKCHLIRYVSVHPPRGGCSTPAPSALVLFVQGRWLTPSTLTQALSTTRCLAYLEVSCSVSLLSMLQWYSCYVLCVIILRAGSEANLVVDLPPCPLHRCFVQCMLLHQGAVTPRSTVIHQWFINALAPIEGGHASASCSYINAAVQVTWPQTSSCAAVHKSKLYDPPVSTFPLLSSTPGSYF